MSKGKGWIGIDLDGCLAYYEDFISPEHIGEPIPAMLERVKAWIAEGQEVRIFTARIAWFDGDEQSLKDSEAADAAIRLWCLKHVGVELPITNRKDCSMWKLYDDRCIQVEKNTGRLVETVPTAHVVQAIASSLIKWGLVAAIDRQIIQASITEATGTSTGVFSIPPEPRPLPSEAAWEDCLEEMRAYLYKGGTHYRGDFHANLGTEGLGGCIDLAELLAVYKHNFLTALLELKQPTASTPQAPTSDIARRLREYCVGTPAEIPWPHRILHEAADELDRLAGVSDQVSLRPEIASGETQPATGINFTEAGLNVCREIVKREYDKNPAHFREALRLIGMENILPIPARSMTSKQQARILTEIAVTELLSWREDCGYHRRRDAIDLLLPKLEAELSQMQGASSIPSSLPASVAVSAGVEGAQEFWEEWNKKPANFFDVKEDISGHGARTMALKFAGDYAAVEAIRASNAEHRVEFLHKKNGDQERGLKQCVTRIGNQHKEIKRLTELHARASEQLQQWAVWGMAELAIRNPNVSSYMTEWEGRVEKAESALKEIHDRINTPEIEDFDKAVPLEAVHQMQRWGAAHDAGKNPEDWFWLVGYLAGKALASFKVGDLEKAKHHCVSTAAAMRNWHAHIRSGESAMRPGISAEKQAAADRG